MKKGIALRKVQMISYVLSIILIVLLVFIVFNLSDSNSKVSDDTNSHNICAANIIQIREASYYLTDEARKYAASGNPEHMDNYFEETQVTKRRENAHTILKQYDISENSEALYEEALDCSSQLEVFEMHSMRLMAFANNISEDNLNSAVLTYEMTSEEKAMSAEDLKAEAMNLLYSDEYIEIQSELLSNLSDYSDAIDKELSEELEKSTSQHNLFVNLIVAFVFVIYAALVLLIFLLSEGVFKPLDKFLKCIKNGDEFPIIGSGEMRELASTYNASAYAHTKKIEVATLSVNEFDFETGAYNNEAFLKEMMNFEANEIKVGLGIIEIDNFIDLKKNLGRDQIKEAFVETYSVLAAVFGSKSVFRISIDQLAIVFFGDNIPDFQTIREKFNQANEQISQRFLTHELTISCGLAFSDDVGYGNTLYNKAQVALYQTKDKGGRDCGYERNI